jgi:hypothetical protein
MAVGQPIKKWTWLWDFVEIRGKVVGFWRGEFDRDHITVLGSDVTGGDNFDLLPFGNYKHIGLPSAKGGYGETDPGVIHLETYPWDPRVDANLTVSRPQWDLPKKPYEEFKVIENGRPRTLRVGDCVRVVGRWVIENAHPIHKHNRGLLTIGAVFAELHPFRWDDIQVIDENGMFLGLRPNDAASERITIAAPIYHEMYIDKWWNWGWANHVFVGDFHNTVTANVYIKAPSLPQGFTPHQSLIDWSEDIRWNGTGLPTEQIRSVTVVADGIKVIATVSAPPSITVDNQQIGDINDPGYGRSVFQADCRVWWKSRLKADVSKEVTVQTVPGITNFQITVWNDGPDMITITGYEITPPDAQSVFRIDTPPSQVNGLSGISLNGTFSPTRQMLFSGRLVILSNDPSGRHPTVQLRGIAGSPKIISVSPSNYDFGRVPLGDAAEITFEVKNVGVSRLRIDRISDPSPNSGFSISQRPSTTINPSESGRLTVLFRPTERRQYLPCTITIVSDADNEPQLDISLQGEGSDINRCAEIDQELADLRLQLNDPSLTRQERAVIERQIRSLVNLRRSLRCP